MATISMLYWQQPRIILIPSYFVLTILVISVLDNYDVNIFVNILSYVVFFLLLGAVFGAFYAYFGGVPIFVFSNEDGRLNQLYLTTLTNSQFENFIRPSGIFDEPGALSFVTCFVAALRHAMGRGKKVTWMLLVLGFVTMSVAHFLYVVLHAIEEAKDRKTNVFMVLASVVIFSWAFMTLFQPMQDIFNVLFLSRFTNGQLGEDRIITLINAIGYIDINSFMFGLNSDCAVGLVDCIDKGFYNYGDNPLTLLVHWGAFLAFPYYFVLIYLAVNSIRKYSFVMLGILFLLLQRPYNLSYGYSMLIMLTIFVLVNKRSNNAVWKFKIISKTPNIFPFT